MDCDGSLDPRDAPRVAEPVEDGTADLVMGRRAAEPGAWPWHAAVGNRLLARIVARRGGGRLVDLGPMRAARRRDLLALGIEDRAFGWPFEMALRAATVGWRIEEVPVRYVARSGRSKVTGTLSGTVRAIRDTAAVARRVRPTQGRSAVARESPEGGRIGERSR
jgi:hypothetical protein